MAIVLMMLEAFGSRRHFASLPKTISATFELSSFNLILLLLMKSQPVTGETDRMNYFFQIPVCSTIWSNDIAQ